MKHEREQCTAELKVWLPPTLRDKIETIAVSEGSSLSTVCRRALLRLAAQHDEAGHAA